MADIVFEGTVRLFSLQMALVKGIQTNDLNTEQHLKRANVGSILFFSPSSNIDLSEGKKNRILEPAVGCTCEKT
jgi:hypothetical protein